MAFTERRSRVGRSSKNTDPIENTLLAIITGAFLLINIMVGMMVHRALPDKPGGQRAEVIVSHGD